MSALCQKRTLRSSFAHTDNRCRLGLDLPAECAEFTLVSRQRCHRQAPNNIRVELIDTARKHQCLAAAHNIACSVRN